VKTTLSSPKWPRLSEDLPGPKSPDRCQSCGVEGHQPWGTVTFENPLWVWREHNDFDGPEPIVVVLCLACSDRLIEPHPRLYSRLSPHEPFPGVMPLCLDCTHRDGVRCTSPKAKLNGGEGIKLVYPEPSRVHFYRRGKGVRSGWETIYVGPVQDCDGKEVSPDA
jgi:hypothetical protein